MTFAALMEAIYMRGDVRLDRRRVKKNTTLHDEILAWEEKYASVMMFSAFTSIDLHGVIIRNDADHAVAAKAEKELKMERDQREHYQKVLIELQERGTGVLRHNCGTV